MSFGPPLVWHHLVEIPSQDQVEDCVEDKTYERVSNDIGVDRIWEIGSDLISLGVDHGPEGEHEGRVWDDAQGAVDSQGRVIWIGRDEREDELD